MTLGPRVFWLVWILVGLGSCTSYSDLAPVASPLPSLATHPTETENETSSPSWPEVTHVSQLVSGYLRAVIAESEGDAPAAAQGYHEAAQANPANGDIVYRALTMHLASGNLAAAVTLAQQLEQQQEPMLPTLRLLLFTDAVQRNDLTTAQHHLVQLRTPENDLLPFALLQAYLSRAQGEPLDAVVQSIKETPTPDGLEIEKNYHLGRMYESDHDVNTALQYYAQGFILNPAYLPIVARLGSIYEQQGQFNKAVDLYKTFDDIKPNSALFAGALVNAQHKKNTPPEVFTLASQVGEVMFSLANIMLGQESFLMAAQFLHMAHALRPQDPYITFYQGIVAEHEQDFSAALGFYQAISPSSGLGVAARLRRAQTLSAAGRYDEAMAILARMIQQKEKVNLARQAMAEILYNQKNYAQAVKYYDALLQNLPATMTPREAALYFARGTAFERLKRFDKAESDLEKSLSIYPDNPVALNYMGYMLVEQKRDLKRGRSYIERALAIKPQDGSIIDSLGWAYYLEGNDTQALQYLERASTLLPADPTVTEHLGDVYFRQGRLSEARTQWQRALRLGPDDVTTRQGIEHKLQALQGH